MKPALQSAKGVNPVTRIRIWHVILLFFAGVFIIRLFYLQVIRHEHYQTAALRGQLKQYEIPPERGIIEAHNDDSTVPIVLNEAKYTLFADPVYVKDIENTAQKIVDVVGGKQGEYVKLMETKDTRYVILANKLDDTTAKKIDKLNLKGVGTRGEPYRTYPQGKVAAQLLGFVDSEGKGKYGIEQALDNELHGVAGQLKAITDAAGVPLAANRDNINIAPKQGKRILLTLDIAMQHQTEEILRQQLKRVNSKSGSVVIMDPKTGAIKAMANYPSYNPAEFYKVADGNLFNNAAASQPLEIGSVMKPFTAAAALDLGVVNQNTTYYDPSFYKVDGATITNIEEDGGAGTRSVEDILQLSLNTGATWLLMQMGGGAVNKQARERWHDYMVNHYQFGKKTGIEQGYEAEGTIPDPNKGYGLNIQYANTSFGQGMTATPLQLASALSGVVNGGTYYRPHLVDKISSGDAQTAVDPQVVKKDVVSSSVSKSIRQMMEYTYVKNRVLYSSKQDYPSYAIGGKTGTAQIAKPSGGYYDNIFNGTFMGFVGGDQPEYVIVVSVDRPQINGYAGSMAAAPVFVDVTNMLINNFGVTPKS